MYLVVQLRMFRLVYKMLASLYELQNLRQFSRLERPFVFWQRQRVRHACQQWNKKVSAVAKNIVCSFASSVNVAFKS